MVLHKDHVEDEIDKICTLSHELLELYHGSKKTPLDAAIEDQKEIGEAKAEKIVKIVGQVNDHTDEGLKQALERVNSGIHFNNATFGSDSTGYQGIGHIKDSTFNFSSK